MTVTVDPLPPPSDTPPGGDAPGGDASTAGAPAGTALAGTEWTDADLQVLLEFLRGSYDKIALATGDSAYLLSKIDEVLLTAAIPTWMPVSWVRAGSHGRAPLIVAIPLTIAVLVAVNLPKIAHWNNTHDDDEQIPIPFVRRRKGPRSDRPRPTEAAPGPGDRRPDTADVTSDRVAAPVAPSEPATAGAVDGGPPADSLDDIKRAYAH